MKLPDFLVIWLTSARVLRVVFAILRALRPNAVFGKLAFITRYDDVADALLREKDFTVHELGGRKMEGLGTSFILGMDASHETTRDRELLRQVFRRDDLPAIRTFIKATVKDLAAQAAPKGAINVTDEYARLASVRLVAHYFGVPAEESAMMRWQRSLFNECFVNPLSDPDVHARGVAAAGEINAHLNKLIQDRKTQTEPLEDNILNRIIAKQKDNAWLDDQAVRRNILCLFGVVENTSKSVVHIMDQLLRRPVAFRQATAAAVAGDVDTVRKYAFEALRFNPHNAIILRHCKNGAVVGQGTKRERTIPPGTTVVVATLSAIFDPDKLAKPRKFDPNRMVECFHFGHGPHLCTGNYISEITIPEMVAELLRQRRLRRAPGRAGRVEYQYIAFPHRFILNFGD
jgi:cytochrome P450